MTIHAGLFRKPIVMENPVKVQNTSGGYSESWNSFLNTRGYMINNGGGREFVFGQDLMNDTFLMYTYWRNGIEAQLTKDTRVIYENQVFKIINWKRFMENRQFMEFTLITAS